MAENQKRRSLKKIKPVNQNGKWELDNVRYN